jgi:hypothetical protein
MAAMRMTKEKYNEELFNIGLRLLECYFGTFSDTYTEKLYKRLQQDQKTLYWNWFINQFEMWETDFWQEYKPIYNFFRQEDGDVAAAVKAIGYWTKDADEFTEDAVIHERFREFILSQK